MKLLISIVLLTSISLLNCACVRRTSTVDKGFGVDQIETEKTLWIWQKEYRNSK